MTGDTDSAAGTSLELIGDLVQARLDAGFIDAWRAGEANAADKIFAQPETITSIGMLEWARIVRPRDSW